MTPFAPEFELNLGGSRGLHSEPGVSGNMRLTVQRHLGKEMPREPESRVLVLWNGLGYLYFLFFWPRLGPCRILVPQPGIEPGAPAAKAPSPNHWTIREVPYIVFFSSYKKDWQKNLVWGCV